MTDDQLAHPEKDEKDEKEAEREPEPVGSALARERAAKGLTLEEVANNLKFAPRQLEALEASRFDALPRGTFLRGMVRSYARLLEVDPEPLLERIADRIDLPDADQLAARYSEPVPFSDAGKRLNVVYAVLSLAVLVVAGAVAFEWQSSRTQQAAATDAIQPRRPAEPAEAAAVRPVLDAAPPEPVEAKQAKTSGTGAKQVETSGTEAKQVSAGRKAAEQGEVLRFKFNRDSWVQVKDGAGHVLMSQLNQKDTESMVEGRPPFSLVIGNAQHVRVVYQDEQIDLAPHIKVEVARFTLP